jgi:Hepatocellular carcinoma-associated antigen 59
VNAADARLYGSADAAGQIVPVARQPVGVGKLMEIDLGPSATLMNIARTEAATRRMQGIEEPPIPTVESRGRARGGKTKTPLGPDGKPWRSRKNRRTDEDLKRDRLVEQVLSESKLDIYDAPAPGTGEDGGTGEDMAADDRLAEQFKQEFLDAQMARNARRTNGAPPAKAGEDRPKGPKLGGSRSARAAMHKAMEEAAKKK